MRIRSFALWWLALASLVLATSAVRPVFAQAQPAGAPSAERLAAARANYERGLKLFDEGAHDGARVEFQKAYELAPSFKILYNLGLVHKQLFDYVNALTSFERYLVEGGSNIEEPRRVEVVREIESLKTRVGSINITTNVEGAEILIDDVSVGRTPLARSVRINPGNRKISAAKTGLIPASRVVQVAGSSTTTIRLELSETRTILVVEKAQRRVPWGGWGITAALAVGAGVTGYLALQSDSKLEDARAKTNADPDDLSSRSTTTRALGITSDVLTVGAVAAGALSLYYTIKWGKGGEQSAPPSAAAAAAKSLKVGFNPGGLSLTGAF